MNYKMQVNGNLNKIKGVIKQKVATLIKNELLFAEGRKEVLIGKMQLKFDAAKNNPHNYHSVPVAKKIKTSFDLLPSFESLMTNKHFLLRERFSSTTSNEKA